MSVTTTCFSVKDNKEEEFAKYEDRWREFWEFMNEALENFELDDIEYSIENYCNRETLEEKRKRMEHDMTQEAKDWFEWKILAEDDMNKGVAEYFLRRTSKFTTVTEDDQHSKTVWMNVLQKAITQIWKAKEEE